MKAKTRIALLSFPVVSVFALAQAAQSPSPPAQPKSGPGGAEVRHQQVVAKLYGTGARAYWLYEPAAPKPARAPLIVFNHGWGAIEPLPYGAWIDHLVKRGNIVVYPLYQDSLRTPVADFTPNAIAAVTDAIKRLQSEPGHVRPQLEKFALAGHSMGGIVSANLAALWQKAGLPRPRAVLCAEPGKTWAQSPQIAVRLEDLSRIPSDTLLLAVAGDRDLLARDVDAKRIFYESSRIPLANKDFVTLVSDEHGEPALQATHAAPTAPGGTSASLHRPKADTAETSLRRQRLRARMQERLAEKEGLSDLSSARARGVDALDFYGIWKLLDGLTDAAFYGKNREFALGNTPQQRNMGRWSDGVPVNELIVTDQP